MQSIKKHFIIRSNIFDYRVYYDIKEKIGLHDLKKTSIINIGKRRKVVKDKKVILYSIILSSVKSTV